MLHLLVMACTAEAVCAERWLPAGDADTLAACEAAAPPVLTPWLLAHEMQGRSFRCVRTEDLPVSSLEEVAPGVFVHAGAPGLADRSNGGEIANLSVVIGPAGIAVIDPGGSRAEGEALLAAIRTLSPLPVTIAILTHVHPDHSLGAEVFREAGARLVAHERFSDALAARLDIYDTNYRDIIGPSAFHGARFAFPDGGVSETIEVDFGGDQLRLMPAGTAHTDNDLAVWHPRTMTLFTGDLVFRELTPVLDGSITGWLGWLTSDHRDQPLILVPGHGAVASNWPSGSRPVRRYLEALAAGVRRTLSDDLSLSEAVPVVVEAMQGQARGWDAFEETTRRNVAAAFKELEWE